MVFWNTYLVDIMSTISQGPIGLCHDTLNLVATCPLGITWVPVDPPHILPHLGFNRLEQKVIDRIHRVGENQLRPGQDAEFVANRIEVIDPSSNCRARRLICTSTPDTKLSLIISSVIDRARQCGTNHVLPALNSALKNPTNLVGSGTSIEWIKRDDVGS